MTRDVVNIGNPKRPRSVKLDILSKTFKAGGNAKIEWFVQPPIDVIVCSKSKQHEISPRIHHVRELCAVISEKLRKMCLTRWTGDGIPEEIEPRSHKLTFGFRRSIWI